MDEIKNRLLQLLNAENISAAKLSELLNVQPSSISHILNGRNKPGYDFLAKLIARFPGVNPRWLLLGAGDMYDRDLTSITSSPADNMKIEFEFQPEEVEQGFENPAKQTIKRIVIFYSDGTFEDFIK